VADITPPKQGCIDRDYTCQNQRQDTVDLHFDSSRKAGAAISETENSLTSANSFEFSTEKKVEMVSHIRFRSKWIFPTRRAEWVW